MLNASWTWNSLFILSGLVLICLELFIGVSTGFDLVLVGLSFVVGGAVGSLFQSDTLGLITLSVLALGYIVVGRSIVKEKLRIATKATNIDAVVEATGLVMHTIEPHKAGQVKIGSELWRATSGETIPVGAKVKVVSVEGSSVNVIKY